MSSTEERMGGGAQGLTIHFPQKTQREWGCKEDSGVLKEGTLSSLLGLLASSSVPGGWDWGCLKNSAQGALCCMRRQKPPD